MYCSPSARSRQTAQIVAAAQPGAQPVEVRIAPELSEIDHGEWSAKTREQVRTAWPDLLSAWEQRPSSMRMPGGESLEEVRQRALRFLDRVRHEHASGRIAVISHGTVIRLLLVHFLGLPADNLWSFALENAALSIVDDHDPPTLTAINDAGHLKGVRSRLDVQVR